MFKATEEQFSERPVGGPFLVMCLQLEDASSDCFQAWLCIVPGDAMVGLSLLGCDLLELLFLMKLR